MNDPSPTRRHALECMLWAGAGILWTVTGGVPTGSLIAGAQGAPEGFSFMQISDSHIGFHAPPNSDTPATLQAAIDLVRARKGAASLMIHTGDVSHLSKPAQFDTAFQIIGGAGLHTHYVPGEHDVLDDDGAAFFDRLTPGAKQGWYSFDQAGVQDAALKALRHFATFRGGDPRAWFLQIVRRAAHSALAGTQNTVLGAADLAQQEDPSDSPEAALARQEDHAGLARALACLPLELRECLVLRELEELSYKQIAEIVQAPIGTIMSRLWRARQMLMAQAGSLV